MHLLSIWGFLPQAHVSFMFAEILWPVSPDRTVGTESGLWVAFLANIFSALLLQEIDLVVFVTDLVVRLGSLLERPICA